MSRTVLSDYAVLLTEVKERVRAAQYTALRAVNRELVGLYWDIGRMLSAKRGQGSWGKAVVARLARDLQTDFPGMQGFSPQNLWRMRQFHELYRSDSKLSPLVREIGWTHNVIIMMHCDESAEREFYIRMTRKFGWSKNVLALQIENQSYQKTLHGQTNFDKALTPALRTQAKLAVKDEYTFDFLELGDEHSERELERALIGRVEHFLREMGGLYAFLGSQFRLEVAGEEFFIDLLLYHRGLRCLLAIDLKVGAFKPEHVGKMQFYLTALDRQTRQPGENSSIGLVLCREKNRTIVEYALHDVKKPIGVATYRIVRRLPRELKKQLPSPEQITKLLEDAQ
jgi:predicted nuclease of restriction endonuclease-like (RecB) superfamily